MAKVRRRPTALVADDAPLIVELVSELLAEAGADVVGQARDGLEAQRLFAELQPDFLVLDYEMPGATGLDVVRHVRTTHGADTCTLVVLTSHGEPAVRQACLDAGADHFLVKSLEVERLLDLVGDIANRLA